MQLFLEGLSKAYATEASCDNPLILFYLALGEFFLSSSVAGVKNQVLLLNDLPEKKRECRRVKTSTCDVQILS